MPNNQRQSRTCYALCHTPRVGIQVAAVWSRADAPLFLARLFSLSRSLSLSREQGSRGITPRGANVQIVGWWVHTRDTTVLRCRKKSALTRNRWSISNEPCTPSANMPENAKRKVQGPSRTCNESKEEEEATPLQDRECRACLASIQRGAERESSLLTTYWSESTLSSR